MADGPTWPCQYQCDEERWALLGKSTQFLGLLWWISRPSVCNLYSGTKTSSYFPSRMHLLIYHSSHQHFLLFAHILYFQKHFHQKYFLPIIFLCQGQLNDKQDPACLSPFIYCRVFAKSRVAVEGQVEW